MRERCILRKKKAMADRKTTDQNKSEDPMATTSNDPMLREHKKTYAGFMRIAARATGGVALVLVLMALFLV